MLNKDSIGELTEFVIATCRKVSIVFDEHEEGHRIRLRCPHAFWEKRHLTLLPEEESWGPQSTRDEI